MPIKRFRALIISLLMIVALLAMPAAAFAASGSVTLSPDKTEAEPGDIIAFTITLSPVSDFGGMQMVLDIPEGLTYNAGSFKIADNLKKTLGFVQLDWTESSKMLNGFGSGADYSSSSETVLGTFTCTVEEGFKGTAAVGLKDLEFFSVITWEEYTDDFQIVKGVVKSASSGEEPGGTEDPSQPADDPDPSGNTDPEPSGNTDPVNPEPSGNTDPEPSGSTDPVDPEPSGNTDPVDPEPSGNTDPEPAGDDTDKGEKDKDKGSKDDKSDSSQNPPDSASADTNTVPGGNTPEPDKNSSEGQNNGSEGQDSNSADNTIGPQEDSTQQKGGFPWWAAVIVVVVIAAVIAVLSKRKKK